LSQDAADMVSFSPRPEAKEASEGERVPPCKALRIFISFDDKSTFTVTLGSLLICSKAERF